MNAILLKGAQEIFPGRFSNACLVVVQRCDNNEQNRYRRDQGYTEYWDALPERADLVVLALGNREAREIWVGKLLDQHPETLSDGRLKYRFLVDHFDCLGVLHLQQVSDADFYRNKGGGGSRVNVMGEARRQLKRPFGSKLPSTEGEIVKRMVWVRRNHTKFRDPVWLHWGSRSAVTGVYCDGLLVASHIKPWSESSPAEKTDFNNGLLLAAPLDSLFDRGLIGFSDSGRLLMNARLSDETSTIFSVHQRMRLRTCGITTMMKKYLQWHRSHHDLG